MVVWVLFLGVDATVLDDEHGFGFQKRWVGWDLVSLMLIKNSSCGFVRGMLIDIRQLHLSIILVIM